VQDQVCVEKVGFRQGKGVVLEFLHVTLEPCEANTDGSAVTLYSVVDSVEDVKAAVKAVGGNFGLPLGVDVNGEFFEVLRTELQPFVGHGIFRFQAHLTC
jgi:hypothetical protein